MSGELERQPFVAPEVVSHGKGLALAPVGLCGGKSIAPRQFDVEERCEAPLPLEAVPAPAPESREELRRELLLCEERRTGWVGT